MKKLIVIFLGILVGAIIPTIEFTQGDILKIAVLLIVGNIVSESFFQREYMRYLAVFFSSMTAGLLSTILFQSWNRIAQAITLIVFAICAVAITVLIGIRENKIREHGKCQEEEKNESKFQEE